MGGQLTFYWPITGLANYCVQMELIKMIREFNTKYAQTLLLKKLLKNLFKKMKFNAFLLLEASQIHFTLKKDCTTSWQQTINK